MFFTLFLVGLTVLAQRIKTVEGYARMEQPDDKTAAEVKALVLKNAQDNAVISAFGSNVSRNNITKVVNENGKSYTSFYMFGENDLRGIWIRDVDKPRIEKRVEEGRIIWEAWVKGEIREVTRAKVEFKWKLLANGTDDRYQTEELHDGDAFYVKFCSPVKGYLLMFMADDKAVVSSILPEEGQDYCIVEANKWQLFHYDQSKPESQWIATIAERKQEEFDQIYIIFSPNKIAPPTRSINHDNSDLDRYSGNGYTCIHVPELSFKEFHKYLTKLLKQDSEVQYEKRLVKISKR